MRWILLIACSCILSNVMGQYYFNDIIATQTGNQQYQLLRKNNIHKIAATSYEGDNSITEGFYLEQNLSLDGRKMTLQSTLSGGQPTLTDRFYDKGRLQKTLTHDGRIENRTDFMYADKGLLQKIVLTTRDTVQKTGLTEWHEWTYNESAQPLSMLRIKNTTDTTVIDCKVDEKGLVIEEHWQKNNRTVETWYYYYNEKKQLTDIVRYNARLKKLVPDFIYEYDANGRISQMTQISFGSGGYLTWQYTYTDKGLKKNEIGFDKNKQLAGRIEYTYE